jgi:filamentous hemagglutinin family protein
MRSTAFRPLPHADNKRLFSQGNLVQIGTKMIRWVSVRSAVLALAGGIFFGCGTTLFANPSGEQVVAGAAQFTRDGNTLTIQQGSQRAIINWQDFSIGTGQLTKFLQPGTNAAALNRVISGNPSQLLGTLEANGQVILVNPNGIVVGAGAVINAGSFIASTLDVANDQFMAGGELRFLGESTAGISNAGTIQTQGDLVLISRQIENSGTLRSTGGMVGLAAGEEVLIRPVGDERLSVIPKGPAGVTGSGTGIHNTGLIEAAQAELKAAGGNHYALAINNDGIIRANKLSNVGGKIFLGVEGGTIRNSGTLEAKGGTVRISAQNPASTEKTSLIEQLGTVDVSDATEGGVGGTVRLEADQILLGAGSLVDASGAAGGGTVLVGGDYQGKNTEVYNAQAVVMAPEARIAADALTSGNGGKVILWSDAYTGFYGDISARGGLNGGDGGFVETSSKDNLQAFGSVDAGATAGKAGLWLLDPRNVTVGSVTNYGAFSGTTTKTFTPTNDSAMVGASDIASALAGGTNVTITTGSTGTQDGNITIGESITYSDPYNATLTFEAANDISLTSFTSISSSYFKLNVVFHADADNNGAGNITVGSNASINTHGGYISFSSPGTITVYGDLYTGTGGPGTYNISGNVVMSGTYSVGDGSIYLTGGTVASTPTAGTTTTTTEPTTTTTTTTEETLLSNFTSNQVSDTTNPVLDTTSGPGTGNTDFVSGTGADGTTTLTETSGGTIEGLTDNTEEPAGDTTGGGGEEENPTSEESSENRNQGGETTGTTTGGDPVGPEREVRPGQTIRLDRSGSFPQDYTPPGMERALSDEARSDLANALGI